MSHPFVPTMFGGGLEGLRSLAAVAGLKLNTGFTAPTERTPSRGSASNVPRVVATMRDGSASDGVHADLTRIAKI